MVRNGQRRLQPVGGQPERNRGARDLRQSRHRRRHDQSHRQGDRRQRWLSRQRPLGLASSPATCVISSRESHSVRARTPSPASNRRYPHRARGGDRTRTTQDRVRLDPFENAIDAGARDVPHARNSRQEWFHSACHASGISTSNSTVRSVSGESGLASNKARHSAFAFSKAVRFP
jgi:hypothetical protein